MSESDLAEYRDESGRTFLLTKADAEARGAKAVKPENKQSKPATNKQTKPAENKSKG